jgi:hypothetical protein
VRVEKLGQLKNLVISLGIEPATLWLSVHRIPKCGKWARPISETTDSAAG